MDVVLVIMTPSPKRKVLLLGNTQCSKTIDVDLIIMTRSPKEDFFKKM
jgi:hypothetical protein